MNERYQQGNNHVSPSLLALPALSEFIGREEETRAGLRLLAQPEVRLLTLTGVGGVGKTRLAQTLVELAWHAFADGMLAVSLATLNQSDLLLPALLQEFGLREEHAHSPLETLVAFLHAKQVLLFLDNFEQIVVGAVLLAELLARCPRLKLLVTSREILRVRGEYVFQVDPLPLPDLTSSTSEAALAENIAVRLFLQRVQAIRFALPMTGENLRRSQQDEAVCLRAKKDDMSIIVITCHALSENPL